MTKSIIKYFVSNPLRMKLFFIFTFIFYGVIISILSYAISNYYQTIATKYKMINTQNQSFVIKADILKVKMNGFILSVESIKNSKILENYINTKDNNENVKDLFSVIMNDNKELSQLRFIDSNGYEKIRFHREQIGKNPSFVETSKLQNKKNRYYFKEIKNTPNNKIWYSKLDLNMEHGKIQRPLVPTLRIGTPVYYNDKFEGIIIVNILFENIIKKFVHSDLFNISIYDDSNHFIHHNNPNESLKTNDLSWSKYLKKDINVDEYNEIYLHNKKGSDYYLHKSIADILPNGENLSVFYEPRHLKIKEIEKNDRNNITTIALVILLFSIPLSYIISIIPNKLNEELLIITESLEKVSNVIDEYVYYTMANRDGKIIDISQAYLDFLGYKKEEIIGKTHRILKHPDTKEEVFKDIWKTILSKKIWKSEISNLKKDGDKFYANIIIKPNLDKNGNIESFISYIQDTTYQKEIEKISITDEMTNLYNRREFNKVFKRNIDNAKRYKHSFSMMIIDIDYFKQYNDTYGHLEGDNVIKKIAKEIRNTPIRSTDLGFRLGGEEFALLFSANKKEDAIFFANKLRENVEALNLEHKGSKISDVVTISVGVFYLDDISKLNETKIFQLCDDALYLAKDSGRNQVVLAKTQY